MRTLIVSLLIGLSPWCMAGQIYTWVDAQGVTHFDAQPPPGQPAVTVQPPVAPRPSAAKPSAMPGSGTIGDQKAIDERVRRQVAEQQTQLTAFCDQARTNLAQLRNNPRLREEVEGEARRLNEEQRQERIAETQKQIKENCQ